MKAGSVAERELEQLHTTIKQLGKQSHHTPQEYPKAIRAFVTIFESGEYVHPDDVKHWATDHGWSDQHARDLSEMADTVYHTLKEVGRI